LHVDDLDLTAGRICIRRSVWEGEEVSIKTKKGYLAVTIDPVLTGMLATHLGTRTSGGVFQTRKRNAILQAERSTKAERVGDGRSGRSCEGMGRSL
jgi:hypothetical protein